MKKLTDDIKRVLAALGNQHAGEYMMPRDKADIVGYARSSANQTVKRLPRATGSASRRVAFLTDGRGEGAPLDYVIELCGRQQASVDLLVHGVVDTKRVDNLKKRHARDLENAHKYALDKFVADHKGHEGLGDDVEAFAKQMLNWSNTTTPFSDLRLFDGRIYWIERPWSPPFASLGSTSQVSPCSWSHVAVTRKKVGGVWEVKLFINGVLDKVAPRLRELEINAEKKA